MRNLVFFQNAMHHPSAKRHIVTSWYIPDTYQVYVWDLSNMYQFEKILRSSFQGNQKRLMFSQENNSIVPKRHILPKDVLPGIYMYHVYTRHRSFASAGRFVAILTWKLRTRTFCRSFLFWPQTARPCEAGAAVGPAKVPQPGVDHVDMAAPPLGREGFSRNSGGQYTL